MNWRKVETDRQQLAEPAVDSVRMTTVPMKAQRLMKTGPNLPGLAGALTVCRMRNSQSYHGGWIEWNIRLAA